jgi:hypothetical protein
MENCSSYDRGRDIAAPIGGRCLRRRNRLWNGNWNWSWNFLYFAVGWLRDNGGNRRIWLNIRPLDDRRQFVIE